MLFGGAAKGQVSVRVVRPAVEEPVLGNEEEEPRRHHRKAGRLPFRWRADGNAGLGRYRGLNPDPGCLPSSNGWRLAIVPRGSSGLFFLIAFV